MRSLLFWLAVSLSAAAGDACGGWLASEPSGTTPLAGATSIAALATLAFAAMFVARVLTGQASRSVFCGAIVALAASRGLAVGGAVPDELPRASLRGQPPRLTSLLVTRSSTPGPRCRAEVEDGSGRRWPLSVAAASCPLYKGEGIAVPTAAINVRRQQGTDRSSIWLEGPLWRRNGDARGWGWEPSSVRLRHAAYEASRGDDGLAFVVASTLGVVTALPPQVRGQLRRSGLGHLIAISGLHVGLAAWLVLRTLGRALAGLRRGAELALLGSWIPVVAYVLATGSGAPAVRAATMLLVASVGSLLGRPTHALTTLALAAAFMLLWDPSSWSSAGFQMSMVAMAVLVRTDPNARLVGVSWRLGWAVLPIAWFHFGRLDGYGVVANAFAVPLFVGWIVPTAAVGAAAVPLFGVEALRPAAEGAELVLAISRWVASWPAAPPFVWISLSVLALVLRGWIRRAALRRALPPRIACIGVLVVAVLRWAGAPPLPTERWHAVPTGGRPSVVAFADGHVCVRDPRGAAAAWARRARDWRGAQVQLVVSPEIRDAPDVAAIIGSLDAELVDVDDAACRFVAPEQSNAAVARCRRAAGGPVEVRWTAEGTLECRLPSGWIEVAATLDDA